MSHCPQSVSAHIHDGLYLSLLGLHHLVKLIQLFLGLGPMLVVPGKDGGNVVCGSLVKLVRFCFMHCFATYGTWMYVCWTWLSRVEVLVAHLVRLPRLEGLAPPDRRGPPIALYFVPTGEEEHGVVGRRVAETKRKSSVTLTMHRIAHFALFVATCSPLRSTWCLGLYLPPLSHRPPHRYPPQAP